MTWRWQRTTWSSCRPMPYPMLHRVVHDVGSVLQFAALYHARFCLPSKGERAIGIVRNLQRHGALHPVGTGTR